MENRTKLLSLMLGSLLMTGCNGDSSSGGTIPPEEGSPPNEGEYAWDIDQWKITIPASKDDWYGSGGMSAAELEPRHCVSSKDVLSNDSVIYHKPHDVTFFEVEDERMVFRANMGFGTTTANSNYIRSELRELFNAQRIGTCSTSSSNTSWFIDDKATNTQHHTLRSTVSVDEYPNISGQEPKVIVGQVHGWKIKQALVKLQWDGPSKPVRAILNKDFYKNNQSCEEGTSKYPECKDWSFSVNLGTYPANMDWNYEITVDGNGIVMSTSDTDGSNVNQHALAWGEEYQDTNNGTVTLAEGWADADVAYYFKAGIYPQFRPDEKYAGELFEVSFSEVEISHTSN
ncbi:polysaccharide lyase family 7 protein [Vibrio maritimus]|uniref:polysaccharide lyase family 7 protein n=1 Tax=Vibrio maritimus TaxID=990268 RepID=UPI004067F3E8